MSSAINSLSPRMSGDILAADPVRAADVDEKQSRIATWLTQQGLDGILIQRPENFAWFTSGARMPVEVGGEPRAALFLTPQARVVLVNNVDSAMLFETELSGLGFLLKERPWTESRATLLDDVCRGRKVASDLAIPGLPSAASDLATMRQHLTEYDCTRLVQVGRSLTHAVEAAARNLEKGRQEAEVAAEIAHRLLRHQVRPVQLHALADSRGRWHRFGFPGDRPIVRYCRITALAERYGLHVIVNRTVCFGSPPDELLADYQFAAMLSATGHFFSTVGSTIGLTWSKVQRIYEKVNLVDEWRSCDQGRILGYSPCEAAITPESGRLLAPGLCLAWTPSVRHAMAGDTTLVTGRGPACVTPSENWPMMQVSVRGEAVEVPNILIL